MVTDRSRTAVEKGLDYLRDNWGEFPLKEKTWKVSKQDYERDLERFHEDTLGGAGAWIRCDGQALMVRHEDETAWSEPGGKQEPSEPLEKTAIRETREETGIECCINGVLTAHLITTQYGSCAPLIRLIVIFEAERSGGDIQAREGEIAEVRWFSDLPNDLLYPEIANYPL